MSNSSFLILFIAFIAFMGVVPFLMRRLGIPSVISLLIVGMLIGPTGVGIDLIALISKSLSFLRDPSVDASHTATTGTRCTNLTTYAMQDGSCCRTHRSGTHKGERIRINRKHTITQYLVNVKYENTTYSYLTAAFTLY